MIWGAPEWNFEINYSDINPERGKKKRRCNNFLIHLSTKYRSNVKQEPLTMEQFF